jgi:hypothetical protein
MQRERASINELTEFIIPDHTHALSQMEARMLLSAGFEIDDDVDTDTEDQTPDDVEAQGHQGELCVV